MIRRGKGRGPYVEIEVEEHINGIEDYYVRISICRVN